jgi:hypothetical protein
MGGKPDSLSFTLRRWAGFSGDDDFECRAHMGFCQMAGHGAAVALADDQVSV